MFAISSRRSAFHLDNTVIDWARRVVVNGGTPPAEATKRVLSKFVLKCKDAGVWNGIVTANCFVNDSFIATTTPLKVGGSTDPWGNDNFGVGDLTINGLAGNASNKRLETGLVPADIFTTASLGASVYVYSNESVTGWEFGVFSSTQTNRWFGMATKYAAASDIATFQDQTTTNISATNSGSGFFSGNRTTATDSRLYFANSSSPITQIGNTNTEAAQDLVVVRTIPTHCVRAQSGTAFQFTNHRLSFIAFHRGYSLTETTDFYNAVQEMRVGLGGGFV